MEVFSMGLFSRKSSKEKRIKKFNKTEEKVIKLIDDLGLCPIFELFRHAMEEDQYRKTGDHFKKWALNTVPTQISKKKMFTHSRFWSMFYLNIIRGLSALLLVEEYEDCLECCNSLIDIKDELFNTKIARGSGNLITIAEMAVAGLGAGGNSKQEQLIGKVMFFKMICLCELGRDPFVRNMLKQFSEDYALDIKKEINADSSIKDGVNFKKDEDYFIHHFKYMDCMTVEYVKSRVEQ